MALYVPPPPTLAGRALSLVGRARELPKAATLMLLLVLVIPAVFAPFVAPHDPLVPPEGLRGRLEPPAFAGGSWRFPLGSDQTGKDVLSRVIYGSRVSITIATTGIAISGTIGTALGLIAGYYRGIIEAVIMRLVDISFSIPPVLLALALAVILEPGFRTVLIVVGAQLWSVYTRQVRGDTLGVMQQDYIMRAKVAGSSDIRILFKHILPNITNTLIVLATLQVGFIILLEAGLSFLGVGMNPPTPSWGLMVADGRVLIVAAWWVALWPGLAILFTVFGFNLLGDWLRDRLDPRLRQI